MILDVRICKLGTAGRARLLLTGRRRTHTVRQNYGGSTKASTEVRAITALCSTFHVPRFNDTKK